MTIVGIAGVLKGSISREKRSQSGPAAMSRGVPPRSRRAVVYAATLLSALINMQTGTAQELPNNFVVHNSPRPLANIQFEGVSGQDRSLADFKGKVVVLNVWATWCVPCRKEMPTLDRLQASLGGPDFQVVPLSIDRGGFDAIRKFYAEISVQELGMYVDRPGRVLRDLGAVGLPTTLIVNRSAEEVARIVGPAEWDSAEVVQFLRPIIAGVQAGTQTDRLREPKPEAPGTLQRGLGWLKAYFGK